MTKVPIDSPDGLERSQFCAESRSVVIKHKELSLIAVHGVANRPPETDIPKNYWDNVHASIRHDS